MLPLALVGCGSIFMGEISIFMNGAGRLRLGVQASDKDEDLGVPSSGAMIAAMGAGVSRLGGGSVSFGSTLVNSSKTESHAIISSSDACLEACSLIENGY